MLSLKALGINKKYGSRTILENINLEFVENEIVFIVGKSGAGKTTLLNFFGAIDKPDSGEILYLDENGERSVFLSADKYRSEKVGFIFQDFNLIDGLSVEDNIDLALSVSNVNESKEEIENNIRMLEIPSSSQKVETLSGGEKQRTAIARALLKDSRIILADEPTGNLDESNSERVFKKLVEYKTGRIVIVVTHDMESANRFADRIITISDGKVVSDEKRKSDGNVERTDKTFTGEKKNKKKIYGSVIRNSIRKRRARFLTICTLVAIAVAFLATAINLYFNTNRLSRDLNVNYLETDFISVFWDKEKGTMYSAIKDRPFEDGEIFMFTNVSSVKEAVPVYGMDEKSTMFSFETKIVHPAIRQIEINDFFRERVMSYEIVGNFISQKDEIIVGEDAARALFEDCEDFSAIIGKKIAMLNSEGNTIPLTIAGINRTQNSKGEYISFICNEIAREFEEIKYSEMPSVVFVYEFVPAGTIGVVDGELGKCVWRYLDENEDVIQGRIPAEKGEALISSAFYDILSDADKETLFEKDFYMNFSISKELNIVGVYESDEVEIALADEYVEDISVVRPRQIECYIKNPDNSDNFINSIRKMDDKLIGISVYQNLRKNITEKNQSLQSAMLVVSAAFFIVVFIMIYTFSKIMVLERVYEIAVLRSLGMTAKRVYMLLLADFAVIMAGSIVVAAVLAGLLVEFLPRGFSEFSMMNITYPLGIMITLSLLTFAVMVVSVFVQSSKWLNKPIAHLLKNR